MDVDRLLEVASDLESGLDFACRLEGRFAGVVGCAKVLDGFELAFAPDDDVRVIFARYLDAQGYVGDAIRLEAEECPVCQVLSVELCGVAENSFPRSNV